MKPEGDRGTARGHMTRLELIIGKVLFAGVATSSICLAVGLGLSLVGGMASVAGLLLSAGIVILLATPVARVTVSMIDYLIEHDWVFAGLTAVVLVELLASVAAALIFNKKV
jgi:uncharacterized membrane protein